jgi:acyl transferase domain-containing protein
VFGNGGGAVVLKRLRDALDDGDHVHAVLAGWAVTNDGADRAGLTVPGVSGQAAVIAEALAVADWDPADIGFVECHGSGTAVGDAIEVDALTRAFRDSGARSQACVLGSVKSNVGNLDAAAGVLGLIKSVLAVREAVIPPTLHFREPHPELDLGTAEFVVGTEAIEWGGPRRAGVSSFGLGGTNAHVLIEQAPIRPAMAEGPEWTLLPLSAMDETALRRLAERLAVHLEDKPDVSLVDVGYTLSVGRRPLPYKAAVACRDLCDAVAGLTALARGEPVPAAGAEPPEGQRVPLPGYPFQRRRHWIDPP